jgi:plastocyanin
MRKSVFLATAVAVLAVIGAVGMSGGAGAADQTVQVGNLYFCSASFEGQVCDTAVNTGDTVTWQHVEGFHTVTQCGPGFSPCPLPAGFESGELSSGQFQQTFDQPGEYWYFCSFHPEQMRGRVIVAAAQPTVAPTSAAPAGQPTAPPAGAERSSAAPQPVAVPAGGGDPGEQSVAGAVTVAGAALALAGVVVIARALSGRRR